MNAFLQVAIFFLIIVLLAKPMGLFMSKVFAGERTFLHPALGWLERFSYKALGVNPDDDQPWTKYAISMLVFSVVGMLVTYALLRLQGVLPLNPQGFTGHQTPPHMAFNVAASFVSNTNWQNYTPEVTVSYFSNMVALAIQNWMSAAVGIAIAIAVIRGFSRHSARGIGNFWADVVRCTLYILLPISFLAAIVFVWQGSPQNFLPYQHVTTLEGAQQTIAMGPVASQEAIKMLGTNGGGIFNANSAHPFENPTPFTNLIQLVLIFLTPGGLTYTLGKMVGNVRQGWAIFAAMSVLFFAGVGVAIWSEAQGNPNFAKAGVQVQNMEGKEVRFGIPGSALFATVTTDASCGAVNSMHDSYTPLGGLVPIFNMQTGEVIFGGVGAGLYGMIVYAVVAVFIAGLMVGRTPEYLGKKIQKFEVQMSMLALLICTASILGFTALASNLNLDKGSSWNTYQGSAYGATDTQYGPTTANVNNTGPHGFSEILYSYTSATANNGSAFAGITVNTPFYNLTLGLAMLVGRYLMIIPILALAGSLAKKKFIPVTSGTFPTDNGTFAALLVGSVLLIGALTFIPALALGPIVEHLQMHAGVTH
jgi:K+-transporting ATPase ATPase A chain